jgi:hypothetical protein
MPPIYPDNTKDFKSAKEELRQKDYELKVAKYEEVYNKKLEYSFNEEEDIGGWN